MVNVIGVRFQNAGKLYFFDPGANWPTPGDFVVVETARGIELGEVVTSVHEMNDEQLTAPLKKVVRIASAQDIQHEKDNKIAEKEAYTICQRKIGEHKLDMKLVSVEYTFDNSKILFYFTANGRVDFRSLVKDLASVFKTRIELRQIGVRDEAKMLGGLGPCGRPICCGAFLGDFQPVSIKMAKEQNLSLNPTKISGVCGRLMCCLKYEEDNYEQTRKRMPKIGREIMTPDGPGTVWDLNVIKESVRVRVQKGDTSELKDFTLEELAQVSGKSEASRQQADMPVFRNAESEPVKQENEESEEAAAAAEKPAQEKREAQRPQRSERNDQPARQRRPRPEKAAPVQVTAEEEKAPVKQTTEKPAQQPQNNANAWKAALERAMRAAKGDEAEQISASTETSGAEVLDEE